MYCSCHVLANIIKQYIICVLLRVMNIDIFAQMNVGKRNFYADYAQADLSFHWG